MLGKDRGWYVRAAVAEPFPNDGPIAVPERAEGTATGKAIVATDRFQVLFSAI